MSTKVSVTAGSIGEIFSCWIDFVANLFASLLDRFSSPDTVRLVEDQSGEFVIQADRNFPGINSGKTKSE